ncbi:MAG: FAD-binding oxidoreductase [Corynebacteriales bacterium]|nr:FAD-binding oxidoreductase [Mycobacteriales bacterium]
MIDLSVDDLRNQFSGQVIGSQDAEYDDLRTVVAGHIDHRPKVIIRVASTQDVQKAIALAREHKLPLAIRSGGHSPAGHGAVQDGIVLDVRGLDDLDIDPATRTAWAGAGITAGAYTAAAAQHGLATGFGDSGSVGVSGITLAGGIGFLVRKHGMTIDQLLAAEIVTADGQVLEVSEEQHPELFWAIRGGGGNFGVITRLKFHLHEVDDVVGGMLVLPATAPTIARFIELCQTAPAELSAIVNVMSAPPMPFLPPEVHGQVIILALMTYSGPQDEGEKAIAPFREIATPLADMLRPMKYAEMFPGGEEGYRPLAVAHNMFLNDVTEESADTILRHLNNSDSPMRAAQLRVLGGAMAEVPADATAFAHRSSNIMVNIAALYQQPHEREVRQSWVDAFAAELQQEDSAAYVGFLGEDGTARIRHAYPDETWNRLARVKATYDPENVFRLNQNITSA